MEQLGTQTLAVAMAMDMGPGLVGETWPTPTRQADQESFRWRDWRDDQGISQPVN